MAGKPDVFKQLKSYHLLLISFAFAFNLIGLFGHWLMKIDKLVFEMALLILAMFVSASSLLFGLAYYKKSVVRLQKSKESVQTRMEKYKTACLIFWALLVASSNLSAVCILMTGNYFFVGLSAMLIIILFLFTPRKENIITQLNLETKEVAELEWVAK
jgi:hypothetical protein